MDGLDTDDSGNVTLPSMLLAITDDIEERPESQITSLAPTRGRVARATDTGDVFVANGSSWVNASSGGAGLVSGSVVDFQGNPIGGSGGVEVRSDDPVDVTAGEPWYNTTEDMLKVPYDDGGSVRVVEVRSTYSLTESVFEDFEGASITDFDSFENGATLSITQQNGSDRLEADASGATSPASGGVVIYESHSKDVSATYYSDSEDGLAGIGFLDGTGNVTYIAIVDLGGGFAGSPSVALIDSSQTIHKTVGITPSNWTGGDFQIRKYEDSNGDIVVEATDPDGNTVTTDPHTPSQNVYSGGVQVIGGNTGSNGAVVYVDDVAKKVVQEISPQLDGYARDDTVPDAYINSGEGVADNGSGLEVVETEVDHDSLSNYASEEHHPVFVQSSVGGAEQLEDAIWVDISQSPPRIKRWSGSSWESTGAEPSTHDNTAHSTDYATTNHDNTAHSTDYATTNHDNTAHSETYALDSDVVSDHANLTNVQTDQHHTRPSAGTGITDDSDVFSIDGKLAVDGSSRWSRKERMVYDAGVLGLEGKSISASNGSTKEYYSHSSRQEVTVSDGTEVYTEFQINGDNDAGVDFGGFKYPIDSPQNSYNGGVRVYVRSDGTNVELVYEILNGNGTTATEQVLDTSTNSAQEWAVSLLIDNLSVAQFVGIETFDVEVRYTRNDLPTDGHNNTDNFSEDISDNPIDHTAKRGGFELVSSASGASIDATIRYLEFLNA